MTELGRRAPRAVEPELDAEQEVDFARHWRTIGARWWVVLAGLAVGILGGYLLSLGGGQFYKAEALLYLGQPFTPSSGGQIQSLSTNPRTVDQVVRSASVQNEVARRVGLRPAQLRGNISVKSVTGNVPRAGVSPLVTIAVQGRPARKVEDAANTLAAEVVERISGYVNTKIEQQREHLAFDERELRGVVQRLEQAQRLQTQLLTDRSLSSTERLIAISNINAVITFAEQRRASLEQDRFTVRQLIKLAEDVEKARVLTPAAAVSTAARSTRNSILVGALLGLLLGAIAALLWDPVEARLASRRPG